MNMEMVKELSATPQTQRNVMFMPGLFEETLRLLLETHDYFHYYGPEDQERIHPRTRMIYSNEMSRITMRLTSIMAWLMVRKAVYAGKITQDEAMDNYRLDSREICMQHHADLMHLLPDYMSHLLSETFRLYERVERLDKLIYDNKFLH